MQLEILCTLEGLTFSSLTVWDKTGFQSQGIGILWAKEILTLFGFASFSLEGFQEARMGAELRWDELVLRGNLTLDSSGFEEGSLGGEYESETVTLGGMAILRPEELLAKVELRLNVLHLSGSTHWSQGGLKGYQLGAGFETDVFAMGGIVAFDTLGPSELGAEVHVDFGRLKLDWNGVWTFGEGELVGESAGALQSQLSGGWELRFKRVEVGLGLDIPALQTPSEAPQAPIARIFKPKVREGSPGELIEFDALGSTDPGGRITRYLWEFGDGERALGRTVWHSYRRPGFYDVTLTVVDDTELLGTTAITLHIKPKALQADFSWQPQMPTILDPVRFLDLSHRDVASWLWDFGDGTTSMERSPKHQYKRKGRFTVTLTIIDAYQNAATVSKVLTVVNLPPVANPGGPYEGIVGKEIVFSGAQSYDLDGKVIRYIWDFGDGTTGEGVRVIHSYRNPGEYEVCLIVIDDEGTSARACTVAKIAPLLYSGGPG